MESSMPLSKVVMGSGPLVFRVRSSIRVLLLHNALFAYYERLQTNTYSLRGPVLTYSTYEVLIRSNALWIIYYSEYKLEDFSMKPCQIMRKMHPATEFQLNLVYRSFNVSSSIFTWENEGISCNKNHQSKSTIVCLSNYKGQMSSSWWQYCVHFFEKL